ncbi:nickel-responsive transcriptional regulator NikR [Natranaerofaba carboxydovora]|uniref:nickel-responsive transcriptional regulator NikR n=1 Tax=Natranaerofaba carboxydovora TaxID=2742683 RepID=UPI001F13534A|nr:nickel-responsive transcriptional regulator NikR [Natranaerofaba carboxydovora]UMZ75126.1 Putative nickel-responsive regulator [Natranaerofaba carboxydovora]
MAKLTRFGISIPETLLVEFDKVINRKGYPNRSEAIRDLIREHLIEKEWTDDREEVAGTVTLVYDHHVKGLTNHLVALQHDYHDMILSTMHIHLDHDNCLEVLVVKGKAKRAQEMVEQMTTVKGVKHGKFTMTSTGKNIS